jgi:hypothetical protein
MPHRIQDKLLAMADAIATSLLFFAVGAMIGIAQLLGSAEAKSTRLILARAITVGGLATAAGAVLIWLPDTPLLGQIGLAAALASLGTSGIERLLERVISTRRGE